MITHSPTQTQLERHLCTSIAAARVYTTSARRARRTGLMRRARQIGWTLNAALEELRSGSPEGPEVARAFAVAAAPKLRQIEVELWGDPAERPHLEDVLEQLDALGVSILPWQRHVLAGYLA